SPKIPHGRLQSKLAEWFNAFAEPARLGLAFTESRATFAGKSYVPDIIYIRWDRLPFTPDGSLSDDYFAPPEIAVEILSPGQTLRDLVARCQWYVANGVAVALFVLPKREIVRVYRPGQPPIELSGSDTIELGDILPGFSLIAAQLFA